MPHATPELSRWCGVRRGISNKNQQKVGNPLRFELSFLFMFRSVQIDGIFVLLFKSALFKSICSRLSNAQSKV